MEVELLEFTKKGKKVRLYLPKFSDVLNSFLTKEDVEALVSQRNDAKKAKNYTEADIIRNELKDKKITLVDHKNRDTTWANDNYHGDETRVFRLEFKIPKKIPTKMSNPNATYISHQDIELYSSPTYGRSVLSDFDEIVVNFHLATEFLLYMRGERRILKMNGTKNILLCFAIN